MKRGELLPYQVPSQPVTTLLGGDLPVWIEAGHGAQEIIWMLGGKVPCVGLLANDKQLKVSPSHLTEPVEEPMGELVALRAILWAHLDHGQRRLVIFQLTVELLAQMRRARTKFGLHLLNVRQLAIGGWHPMRVHLQRLQPRKLGLQPQKQVKPQIPTGGKFGRLPKGFVSTAKRLPRFGRNVIILDRYGVSYRAVRIQSCFYACGWVWEDINYRDHYAEDIIAWKDGRK